VQAIVLPIADRQNDYAREVHQKLIAAGMRAEIDERSDKVNFKIREAQLQKIPYMLVVGDREAQAGQVAVRNRKHGDQGAVGLEEFIDRLTQLCTTKSLQE
jgi:threonyl-tRNA synthetase